MAFFRDILDFEATWREADYAYIQREGCGIRMLQNRGTDGAQPGNRRFAYYVDVRDVDALYAELKPRLDALSAGDVHGPADKTYRQCQLFVVAPDSNLIAFGQANQALTALAPFSYTKCFCYVPRIGAPRRRVRGSFSSSVLRARIWDSEPSIPRLQNSPMASANIGTIRDPPGLACPGLDPGIRAPVTSLGSGIFCPRGAQTVACPEHSRRETSARLRRSGLKAHPSPSREGEAADRACKIGFRLRRSRDVPSLEPRESANPPGGS